MAQRISVPVEKHAARAVRAERCHPDIRSEWHGRIRDGDRSDAESCGASVMAPYTAIGSHVELYSGGYVEMQECRRGTVFLDDDDTVIRQ